MTLLTQTLQRYAVTAPHKIALQDTKQQLSYRELEARVDTLAKYFAQRRPRVIGLLADNGCDWAIVDLAAYRLQIPIVPLPIFFSATQIANTIRDAGIDLIITDRPTAMTHFTWQRCVANPICSDMHDVWLRDIEPVALPESTWKITFTSGSTGNPKGVCLARDQLDNVATQLCTASAASMHDRHLCMLPLSTLLENIGGLYAALLAGATIYLPDMQKLGVMGSSGLHAATFLAALLHWQPSTGILVPQLLQALVALGRAGARLPQTLRYIAVGGAPIANSILQTARAFGLPVHEGYGLSECGSVIAVNRADADRLGSVGRPLPHVHIGFADDGEILVRGLPWLGYLGDEKFHDSQFIATGDIGYLDDAGFLFITGRKKNLFITAFGRNVAPEWVERELIAQPSILQAAVFGEGRACNCAVIVAAPAVDTAAIIAALHAANANLPDYAQVQLWLHAAEPFSPHNHQATANGRLRREQIYERYADDIDAIYASTTINADIDGHAEFLSASAVGNCA
ncbi:MAG TPA: AMP-binding protein [Spongiibacteraceae bacterium]|nr:AMP-binding protein [Spongiibacteraceae bacterium]